MVSSQLRNFFSLIKKPLGSLLMTLVVITCDYHSIYYLDVYGNTSYDCQMTPKSPARPQSPSDGHGTCVVDSRSPQPFRSEIKQLPLNKVILSSSFQGLSVHHRLKAICLINKNKQSKDILRSLLQKMVKFAITENQGQ